MKILHLDDDTAEVIIRIAEALKLDKPKPHVDKITLSPKGPFRPGCDPKTGIRYLLTSEI